MPTPTFIPLSTYTVGASGISSITFNTISQSYKDLYILISSRSARAAGTFDDLHIKFNGSSASYQDKSIYGNGASVASGSFYTDKMELGGTNQNTNTANLFSVTEVYIPSYTSSENKSAIVNNVSEENATTAYVYALSDVWANTAAITDITIGPFWSGNNLVQYSSATLYGITNS